jgi:hypothetical protein
MKRIKYRIMNDYDSDASTICDAECACIGHDEHVCGTLDCVRCGKEHSNMISIDDNNCNYLFRLIQDKAYEMNTRTCVGDVMREQQMVFIEHHPLLDGLYYFV